METNNKWEMELHFEKTKGADKEFTLVPLDSHLWNVYEGAYGAVTNDVALLTGQEKKLDDWDIALLERRQSRQGQEEDIEDIEKIALENLFESIAHQMTFYSAIYLVMPYLVKLLEKRNKADDFEGQLSLITDMGMLVSMDISNSPYKDDNEEIEEEVMASYKTSILKFQDITKKFLEKHIEKIKQLDEDSYYKVPFLTSVFGILDKDKKASFAMWMSMWEGLYMVCGKCGDCNECEFDDGDDLDRIDYLTPAPSVLGQWDGTSLEDSYLWFSNLLWMAGADREVKILSYYYGNYKCTECGNEDKTIKCMKNYYFD